MKISCYVNRGTQTESIHKVYAIVINENKEPIFSSGPQNYTTCFRSSFKPFQASAAIYAGATKAAQFSSKEIALMCASHNGEKIHVQTAKKMAEKLGISINNYECGSHPPFHKSDREKIRKDKRIFTAFHNNCSGKHSGMLALAKHLQVHLKNYTKQNHPVQKAIFHQLARLTGIDKFHISIDGCSAPTPFVSLLTIAHLFQKLGSNTRPELIEAYNAMAKHPYLVGGKNRFDTDFITTLKGRGICKAGGEAIRGLVINTKKYGLVGIALKVIDGNQRAIETATMAILNHLKILTVSEKQNLKQYEKKLLYNHRKLLIGEITTIIH